MKKIYHITLIPLLAAFFALCFGGILPGTTNAGGFHRLFNLSSNIVTLPVPTNTDTTLSVEGIVYARNFPNLNAAVAAIGEKPATLIVSNPVVVKGNCTTPSTLEIQVLKGGKITAGNANLTINGPLMLTGELETTTGQLVIAGALHSSGKITSSSGNVMINGPFHAGLKQVFYGHGTVYLGENSVKEVVPQWWGAVGNNENDDYPAFQNAIKACELKQHKLLIPEGSYLLSKQLVINNTFDIQSDHTAAMRWSEANSCGILFNYLKSSDTLCNIDLPQLFSPQIDKRFIIPGYGPKAFTYNLHARHGNAIHIRGGNRINISVQYIAGWDSGILVESTSAPVVNVDINVNTIDFCTAGIKAMAHSSGTAGISSLVFRANTVWAKFPIFIDAKSGFINSSKFAIDGQAFVNEPGGCGVYAEGTKLDTCSFSINWLYAGHSFDSTTGVSRSLVTPFIGGDQASNNQTSDGNSPDVAYFKGSFCDFDIGAVMGIPGGKGASSVPVAGDTIRIRDAGKYNKIIVRYSDNIATAAIPVSNEPGESNYNRGIGGAQYSNKVLSSVTIPSLSPMKSSGPRYIYHQNLSAATRKLVKIFPHESSLTSNGLVGYAIDEANKQNRQVRIEFTNTSSTPSPAGTYYFWLEL